MMHRAWSSIVEVPYCFSRSYVKFQGHTALKIVKFDPNGAFPDSNSSLNSPMAMKCCTKLETAKERCPIVFQGHPSNFKVTRDKTSPILTQIGRFRTIGRSQLSNPSDLPCFLLDSLSSTCHFLAATKQLYDWFSPSVCPSVRLSVCPSVTPFSPCSHHRIIMKFSGVITNDKSDVHEKDQGQRSKFKVTEVNTQLNRFRTVTPVWIHILWWNDAYSLMMHRRGALLFFKVIRQISRSHSSKKRRIWPRLGVSGL